jgi:signal transduction histidine kinase/ActR/RegA family two-component response regulator
LPVPSPEEENLFSTELKRLKLENTRLARELRITREFLDKVTRTVEAKEALEKALSAANARQKAYTSMLLESCPNIIMLLDDGGRLVLSTRKFLTLTGIPNFNYIINRTWEEIFLPYLDVEDLGELKALMESVTRERKTFTLNKWIDFGKTGEPRWYSVELQGIGGAQGNDVGITSGILAVFLDLTEIMREKQKAEAANSAKSDFLAVMSHEIRTPMNAILGLNEILSRTELTEIQGKYLRDIRKSAQSLLTIINDILDFSKIEAGKLEIISAGYNIRALLDNLHSMFNILYKGKNLELGFTVEQDFPKSVCGDENRTRQVLTNLLSNALKYTPGGRVDFRAFLENRDDHPGGMLRFDVKDTGIGIRDEDTAKLFKPFEQLDTRKNRNVVGTGLGLAICYRLCQLMGGDLWVKSVYGKGSVFSVLLPNIPAENTETEDEDIIAGDFTAPDAKILVVDDIEINLEVCGAMLAGFGITADLAQSGREAVEMAEKNCYDLVFMDHMMPEMDGIEATALIRSLGDRCALLPIIALTANVIGGAEQMFKEHKFNGLLAKPIEFAALGRCLRQWLPQEKIIEK